MPHKNTDNIPMPLKRILQRVSGHRKSSSTSAGQNGMTVPLKGFTPSCAHKGHVDDLSDRELAVR